jgi:hypothetical protein
LLYGHAYQKKIGAAASARRLFGAPVVPREGKQGASHGKEQQAPEHIRRNRQNAPLFSDEQDSQDREGMSV